MLIMPIRLTFNILFTAVSLEKGDIKNINCLRAPFSRKFLTIFLWNLTHYSTIFDSVIVFMRLCFRVKYCCGMSNILLAITLDLCTPFHTYPTGYQCAHASLYILPVARILLTTSPQIAVCVRATQLSATL